MKQKYNTEELKSLETNKVVIHGGGYVGLVGGVHFALAGVDVVIYDPDQLTCDSINNGEPRAGEYLGYIDDDVKNLVHRGKIQATTDYDSIKAEKIHLLAVPTEKGNTPTMDIVLDCIKKIYYNCPDAELIIVESTLMPGTIDKLIDEGHVFGNTLSLAVCPRLDWFADKDKNVTNLPRIIGGVTQRCTDKAAEVLNIICKDIRKTTYRVAEYAKSGQNALYYLQIMGAYQMAQAFQNCDFNEALRLISAHWRLPDLYLGPGTSGRCVAMGAQYITEAAKNYNQLSLFNEALSVDQHWRENIGDRLTRDIAGFGHKAKILVLGVAYRPEFSDYGNSAGLDIAEYLSLYNWDVYLNDPILGPEKIKQITPIPWAYLSETNFAAILLATGHSAYKDCPRIDNWMYRGQFILDACGLWEEYRDIFKSKDVKYVRVGEENWLQK